MSHSLSRRPLSEQERQRITQSIRFDANRLAWIIAPCLGIGFFGYMLGSVIAWAGGKLGVPLLGHARIGFVILGVLVGLLCSIWMYSRSGAFKSKNKDDLEKGEVEVVHAKDVRCIQQEEHNDEGLILYFDLGERKVLALSGHWIFDRRIFGAQESDIVDGSQSHINGLSEPFAFPSTEFILHRTPIIGLVLKVEVKGARLKPERALPRRRVPARGLPNSQILDGSFEEMIAQAERSKLA